MRKHFTAQLLKLAAPWLISAIFFMAGLNVAAQSNNDYSISWDTETSFDQIPFGEMVRYVFMTVAFAKEHDVLTQEELSLIYDAEMENPKPERTYRMFEEGCLWYQSLGPDDDLDVEYAGSLFRLADQYEAEDKVAPYLAAYEKLSRESKKFILDKIESFRGTRVMSSSTVKWDELFVDRPETAERAFDRLCDRLPQMLEELENWPEQKSFDNAHAIKLE